MPLSKKIRTLLITAFAVVILVFAANEGTKNTTPADKETIKVGTTLKVPRDIDPRVFDWNSGLPGAISSKPAVMTTPKPSVAPRPAISAEAYLVADLDSGEVYSEHNAATVFPIASLSKLLVALVVLHNMNPDQKITITQPMLESYGEAGHLVLGETLTASELMYPLLLESSNDAAEAFAQSYGYNPFIQKMNAYAQSLGMTSTAFKDPSGLSSGNISNARDLLKLARNLYTSEKPLLELTRQIVHSVASTTDHGSHIWNTINPFPWDTHFIGGKTGRTIEAKESMVSLFKYQHKDIEYHVAVIVLRSDFSVREIDSSVLFERFIQKINTR